MKDAVQFIDHWPAVQIRFSISRQGVLLDFTILRSCINSFAETIGVEFSEDVSTKSLRHCQAAAAERSNFTVLAG